MARSGAAEVRQEVGIAAARQVGLLERLAADDDWRVRVRVAEALAGRGQGNAILDRLAEDEHPHVRGAALTPDRAADLVREPTRETSWHVLAVAARMAKVPLWRLEPQPAWQPPHAPDVAVPPLAVARPAPPHARRLGPEGILVAPLGVSGHYGLPEEGFARALQAGVNLFFWEPGYETLTRFAGRLAASQRRGLHFITGTFGADGARVRRDAERALRELGVERLAVFLVFWVQSWARLAPDVLEALDRLRAEGKVGACGLSTHSRPLAVRAIEEAWDPVMVRHSAAHRGAEEAVLPRAREAGRGLITFNNTCYGRLLRPRLGLAAPGAADCYRYSLAQPAVAACLAAPSTLEQLEENLDVLHDAVLPEDRRALLLAQGASLYDEEKVFWRLVRSR
jgi:hypothetical protein